MLGDNASMHLAHVGLGPADAPTLVLLHGVTGSAVSLADGLTRQQAIDTAWAIASPESYDLLVRRLGYSLDEFRFWMERTLSAAILAS